MTGRRMNQPATRALLIAAMLFVLLANSRSLQAETLYTVNRDADTLVGIDANNGNTTTIGPIGYDMYNTDLTLVGQTIFAVTADGPDIFGDPGFTLVAINPMTGAMISSVALSVGGNQPRIVESIGHANGKLYVGYSPTDTVSTHLGIVNPSTGEITGGIDYSAVTGANAVFGSFGVDLDGLSSDSSESTVLALDRDDTAMYIARIDPVNVTVQGVKQFSLSNAIDDLALTSRGLYVSGGGFINKIDVDAVNPVVATFAWNPTGTFTGLAAPEPSTFALAILGIVSLVIVGARSARRRHFSAPLRRLSSRLA
jgi:hypothetical protein